jgi:hypothetical protein
MAKNTVQCIHNERISIWILLKWKSQNEKPLKIQNMINEKGRIFVEILEIDEKRSHGNSELASFL